MSDDVENLLKEINFLAHSKGVDAFVRGKLQELHREVRKLELGIRADERRRILLNLAITMLPEHRALYDRAGANIATVPIMPIRPAAHGQGESTPPASHDYD